MLLIDLAASWRAYHAHSPYRVLMEAAAYDPHSRLSLYSDAAAPVPEAALAGCDGILTDRPRGEDWPDLPTACLINDIHRHTKAKLNDLQTLIRSHTFCLSPYRYAILPDDPPHLTGADLQRMVIFPHCVPDAAPLPFSPCTGPPAFAVAPLAPRNAHRPYPMLAALQAGGTVPPIDWAAHPGYDPAAMAAAQAAWWPTLAAHRIGVVGLGWGRGWGRWGYPLAKYVEYLHAGLLLMAEKPSAEDCTVLGLADRQNCLLFEWPEDEMYFRRRLGCATYLAQHEALADSDLGRMAAAGQRLARFRHTASARLRYLHALFAEVRRNGIPGYYDQIPLFLDATNPCKRELEP
ncbi:MAG: hypothetical protein GX547_16360 [Phycisphaerae bacterium]|nr:hypothetical protein [Phycisphaerae bacterium]